MTVPYFGLPGAIFKGWILKNIKREKSIRIEKFITLIPITNLSANID